MFKLKRHSKFVGGYIVVFHGKCWVRAFGILAKGDNRARWTGGINWTVRDIAYGETLGRASLAMCKYRITKNGR